jgi:hypothetical protein
MCDDWHRQSFGSMEHGGNGTWESFSGAQGESPSNCAEGTEAVSEKVRSLSATLQGYVCLHGRRYVALAFTPHRYPYQSRRRNLAVNRTLRILDWLQDSALQGCKNEAFILFMIDAAKRVAEDLLKHCHAPETPFFKE